jgi:polysaccharide biosynthesis protein PslG
MFKLLITSILSGLLGHHAMVYPPVSTAYHGPHYETQQVDQSGNPITNIFGFSTRRNHPKPTPIPTSPPLNLTPTPTLQPNPSSTPYPTLMPTVYPSTTITQKPSLTPTIIPSPTPTKRPSLNPTPTITQRPTPLPTVTLSPTPMPIIGNATHHWGIAAGGSLTSLSQSALDLYFSELQNLGVSWVRFDFDWGSIQPDSSNSYNWSGTDRVVAEAQKNSIHTLGLITYTPTWAQASVCKGTFACAPADPNTFGTFAAAVANRYAPLGVHTWEIWNEPNLAGFWKPSPNVADYVQVLKNAYQKIKAVDVSALVLSGGLSAAGDEPGAIAPITFTAALYQNDPTKDFDAISLHPYSYPVVASYIADWNSWQQIVDVRQVMMANNDSSKKIWVTEYGSPTNGPGRIRSVTDLDFNYGSDYMSESAQAIMMSDVLTNYLNSGSFLNGFFWYSLKDLSTNTSSPENFFGLLRPDGSSKPAYNLYRDKLLANP